MGAISDLLEIVTQRVSSYLVRQLAAEAGFDVAGVTNLSAAPDFDRFRSWVARGLAGEMHYLTDHRADRRQDLEHLLPGVRSLVSFGKVYQRGSGGIAGYAHGADYHVQMRRMIEEVAVKLAPPGAHQWRACVDTAPILERSFAREAGLGWIGKNTCVINQQLGSFLLLGELLTTLEIETDPVLDAPPPDRCGSCRRCIDACPTAALVASPDGRFELDARLCISYFTIELRGVIPEEHRAAIGENVFGCDICQDICPWNRHSENRSEPVLSIQDLAGLSEPEYRARFRDTAVSRTKYGAFLRNVAVAMGNSGSEKFREPLGRLAASDDPLVVEHAQWGLGRLAGAPFPESEPGALG